MLGSLSAKQVERLLLTEVVGRIGCQGKTRSYVVPVTYAYDGEAIYVRSADGLKVEMMRENPQVCFEVDHIEDLRNWQSVITWGTFEELKGTDAEEAAHFLERRLHPRVLSETFWSRGHAHETGTGELPVRPVVYRIRLLEKTGRFERESGHPAPTGEGTHPARPPSP